LRQAYDYWQDQPGNYQFFPFFFVENNYYKKKRQEHTAQSPHPLLLGRKREHKENTTWSLSFFFIISVHFSVKN